MGYFRCTVKRDEGKTANDLCAGKPIGLHAQHIRRRLLGNHATQGTAAQHLYASHRPIGTRR